MRRLSLFLLLGFCVLVATAWAQEAGSVLVPGKNLPGTFHPFNVTVPLAVNPEPEEGKAKVATKIDEYSPKNKFHSLITQYDLDPVVMLFVRSLDENKELQDLLKKLDAAIDRNRKKVRLRAFVVFVPSDLADVQDNDEQREEYTRKIADLAADLKLSDVILTLSCDKDLKEFGLDPSTLTAVLYRKLNIVAVHRAPADKIDAAAKDILADVTAKFGAK
jgi:hypothetical protein